MAEEGGLLSSTNVTDIAFTAFRPEPTSIIPGLLIPLLSVPVYYIYDYGHKYNKHGGGGGIRTPDTTLHRITV